VSETIEQYAERLAAEDRLIKGGASPTDDPFTAFAAHLQKPLGITADSWRWARFTNYDVGGGMDFGKALDERVAYGQVGVTHTEGGVTYTRRAGAYSTGTKAIWASRESGRACGDLRWIDGALHRVTAVEPGPKPAWPWSPPRVDTAAWAKVGTADDRLRKLGERVDRLESGLADAKARAVRAEDGVALLNERISRFSSTVSEVMATKADKPAPKKGRAAK